MWRSYVGFSRAQETSYARGFGGSGRSCPVFAWDGYYRKTKRSVPRGHSERSASRPQICMRWIFAPTRREVGDRQGGKTRPAGRPIWEVRQSVRFALAQAQARTPFCARGGKPISLKAPSGDVESLQPLVKARTAASQQESGINAVADSAGETKANVTAERRRPCQQETGCHHGLRQESIVAQAQVESRPKPCLAHRGN